MGTYSRLNSQCSILHKIQDELNAKSYNKDTEFYKLIGTFYALGTKYLRLSKTVYLFDSTYQQINSEFDRLYSEQSECFFLSKYQNFYLNCKELSELNTKFKWISMFIFFKNNIIFW